MGKIWLIQTGEPASTKGSPRLMRTGLLGKYLAERGHQVTWWASDFDHTTKSYHTTVEREIDLPWGVRLKLLHSPRYDRNLSIKRVFSHAAVAREFTARARRETRPDLILCALPTLELARAAVAFGRESGVPVCLDIRDLWPDAIAQVSPSSIRPLVGLAANAYFYHTNRTLRRATGLIGISDGYLDWGLRRAGRAQTPQDAVFPLGYEPSAFSESAKAAAGEYLVAMGVDPTRPIVWFVGTFGVTYDLDTVIGAAAISESRKSPAQFVFSGDGEHGPAWRRAAQGIENVVFTGMIDGPSIAWMLDHAQIGLAAYQAGAPQGLPNKVFEYMSGGLAIGSSLGGEFDAIVRAHEIGFSYPPGDPQALADLLKPLIDDAAKLKECRSNSIQLFTERFNARMIYPRICEFLERHASEPIASPP